MASREIPFTKCHGLGNDVVLIDAIAHPGLARLRWNALSRALCDRRRGVGADQLILLTPASTHHLRMRVLNADGSDGGMCGNGIRCVARYMTERHAFRDDSLRVDVLRVGTRDVHITRVRGRFAAATVDMGPPTFEPGAVPCSSALANTRLRGLPAVIDAPLPASLCKSLGPLARSVQGMTCVSMGNPHAVLWCDAPTAQLASALGPVLQASPLFPQSVNVHVARIDARASVTMHAFERGAGLTLACGTGACAVVAAGIASGRLSPSARVRLPGGELRIRQDEASGSLFKTGPAITLFSAAVPVAALQGSAPRSTTRAWAGRRHNPR